jgi:ATP phosphoribosyltransferase
VQDGVADIGFVGENVVYEKAKKVEVAYALGFGKCRLSFAIQKGEQFTGPQFLAGKKIATSYPVLVQKYLDEHQITAEIHEISGSVEIAPGIGLADVVCDLVSSGSTLFMNGLKEAETILNSQAVLVKRNNLNGELVPILERLLFRMESVKKAKKNKYVLMNAPNAQLDKIIAVLPGMKSPTIVPLATEGWSSVHTVIEEADFWNLIEQLKALGAEGILVVPIEKMIL